MSNEILNNSSVIANQQTYEAEAAVVGILIYKGELLSTCDIKADIFSIAKHRMIVEAMLRLEEKGEPIELPAIVMELGSAIEEVTVGYIGDLAASVVSVHTLDFYIGKVKEFAIERKARNLVSQFLNEDMNMQDLIGELNILDIGRQDNRGKDMAEIVTEVFEDLNSPKGATAGIAMGFPELDRIIDGLQGGDMVIVGARPAMGKTAFVLNILSNFGKAGISVSLFNYEMRSLAIGRRMFAINGNIETKKLRSGDRMEDDDWTRLSHTITQLSDYPVRTYEASGMNPRDIKRCISQDMKRFGKEQHVVIIDYLQLVASMGKSENQNVKIGDISRELKLIALQLGVPVIVLSQLSRNVESRADKRPMMSDLRDSGNIEQDADIIAMLYRDEYYNKDTEDANMIEVIIAKQRDGGTGSAKLGFSKEFGKILSFEEDYLK